MKWITAVGDDLGGPERATAMLKGKGVSFILKSLSIDFKRPVTYPDTVRSSLWHYIARRVLIII